MARDLAALFKIQQCHQLNSGLRAAFSASCLRLILEVVPADHGAIVLMNDLDEYASRICTLSRRPGEEQPIEIKRQVVHRVIWDRSAVLTNPHSDSSVEENLLCVPLIGVESIVGVIYLVSSGDAPPFREDHVHFLDSVSRIAAVNH